MSNETTNAAPRPTPTKLGTSDVPTNCIPPKKHSYLDSATDSLGFDALLPSDDPAQYRGPRGASWLRTRDEWRARIESEQLHDLVVFAFRSPTERRPLGFHLRTSDGAFSTGLRDGQHLAIQPTAWGQLVSLFLTGQSGKPSRASEAYAFLSPPARAAAFADIRDRAPRKEGRDHPLFVRSHVDRRTGQRAVRAVLSGRHSGVHFDDLAVSNVLDMHIPAGAPAFVSRTHDETRGWAVLDDTTQGVSASLSWANSETGGCSLQFAGGVRIHALDVAVYDTSRSTNTELLVAVESQHTRRAHTLPRVGVSEAERAAIAAKRMDADVRTATDAARELIAEWTKALVTFPEGFDSGVSGAASRDVQVAVLMDLVTSKSSARLTDAQVEQLRTVLTTESRLFELPFGSVAQIAAAFAVVARDAKTWNEQATPNNEARAWLRWGFGPRK